MPVFGFSKGKRVNQDREAKPPYPVESDSDQLAALIRSILSGSIQQLDDDRIMMTVSDEKLFGVEIERLKQAMGSIGDNSGADQYAAVWQLVAEARKRRVREEGIFVEGRFFEYQQLLFDFSRLIRQIESKRRNSIAEIKSLASQSDEAKTLLPGVKQILDREERALRTVNSIVTDRLQSIRNILLEERVTPERHPNSLFLTRSSFESAISRYINVSNCTSEPLHLILFSCGDEMTVPILANAIRHVFRRQADCAGHSDDLTIGVLTLNVTAANVKMLISNVTEFIKCADVTIAKPTFAAGRFDDTPQMLLVRAQPAGQS